MTTQTLDQQILGLGQDGGSVSDATTTPPSTSDTTTNTPSSLPGDTPSSDGTTPTGEQTPGSTTNWDDEANPFKQQFTKLSEEFKGIKDLLQEKVTQPQIEEARQAFESDIENTSKLLRTMGLTSEESDGITSAYRAGKLFEQAQPNIIAMSQRDYAYELAADKFTKGASWEQVQAFVQEVSKFPDMNLMKSAADLFMSRTMSTNQQQIVNSGQERTEGGGGNRGFSGGLSDQDFMNAWAEGAVSSTHENLMRAKQLQDRGVLARAR